MPEGEGGGTSAVVGVGLREDVADMDMDGALAEGEQVRDLTVGVSGCDLAKHFDLANRQSCRVCGFGIRGFLRLWSRSL